MALAIVFATLEPQGSLIPPTTIDKKKSKTLSLLALIIGLIFTQWKEILANEGGTKTPIVSLDIGYWLWIISFGFLYIGTLIYFSTGKAELKNKH